jgi:hypothetical protein
MQDPRGGPARLLGQVGFRSTGHSLPGRSIYVKHRRSLIRCQTSASKPRNGIHLLSSASGHSRVACSDSASDEAPWRAQRCDNVQGEVGKVAFVVGSHLLSRKFLGKARQATQSQPYARGDQYFTGLNRKGYSMIPLSRLSSASRSLLA